MIPPALLAFITPKAILYTVLATLVIGTLIFVKYQSDTIRVLRDENAKLQTAIQDQIKTIDALQKDYKAIIAAKDAYNEKVKQLEKKTKDLEDKLWREREGKASLEELALRDKKNRIEKLINDATLNVLNCIRALTGNTLVKCLK